ncbi:MAG: preprotein translocase subunit TatA [Nitrospirae bacterium GWC2_57_13]|jgi:sec-independent protein translocase protein TatA|nr:MAG: preprotein translocase subunit TatA [Nitrospirae bacterium GWC2_57_13]HAR45190.1 twin-arginine translocase TatA/TatE family subunit [Nitrospiraceae bacterium]HAS53478.1 twin-arginine translocase TatA/TatE family subunit [Nitrospiraceae bacterium]
MFGLGMQELIIILLIVLVIFGASRLPMLGEGLGKAIKGFKKGISEAADTDKDSDRNAKS